MKITRLPNGSLLVESTPILISLIILACLLISLLLLVKPFFEQPPRYKNILVGVACLALCAAFAHFLWERVRFVFDPATRQVTWERRGVFRSSSGTIPFADVTSVSVERATSTGASRSYRVVLETKDSRIPLTKVYTHGTADHEEVARTIKAFVGKE